MASRLSGDSVRSVYEQGHQAFALAEGRRLQVGLAQAEAEINHALAATEARKAVQAIPNQRLYVGLKSRGIDSSLDVLDLISREQFVALMDYDAWAGDRLIPRKLMGWLQTIQNISPAAMVQRFRELDEEYQLAFLGPFVRTYDEEEYEQLGQAHQDRLGRMPCNTLFYELLCDDDHTKDLLDTLINTAVDVDVSYAYSLLAHAAHMPPNEQEALIAQFRRARLEEDGFVTEEEAQLNFRPLDPVDMRQKWRQPALDRGELVRSASTGGTMFERALACGARRWTPEIIADLNRGFAYLGNALCAASGIEPDDVSSLRTTLLHAQGLVSLALDDLSGGEAELAADILAKEYPKSLFRVGLSLVGQIQESVLAQLIDLQVPGAERCARYARLGRFGLLLDGIDADMGQLLGLETTEVLKALLNRFPLQLQSVATDSDQLMFAPVTCKSDLQSLAADLDQRLGMLRIAAVAVQAASNRDQISWPANTDHETILRTAVVQATVNSNFVWTPVLTADLEKYVTIPVEAMRTITADFFASVEPLIRKNLSEGKGTALQTIGSNQDPVLEVLHSLSDLLLELDKIRLENPAERDSWRGLIAITSGLRDS